MSNKVGTIIRHFNNQNIKIADINLHVTAPPEVSWSILSSKFDKQTMINKCLKKRKELLDA